jgi:putative phage-type endonuclease
MNFTYINELEELENIIDNILPEDEPLFFIEEEHIIDFIETALLLMDNYIEDNPTAISEPDFYDYFVESVKELLFIQFEEHINLNEEIEDDMNDILEDAFNIYFETFYQGRTTENKINNIETQELSFETCIQNQTDNIIKDKIEYLRSIPQPVQRTPEWYSFRHNLITASNAYKAFESQSIVNQIIYEKCQPLKTNDDKFSMVNVNSTFHWGQKYEPLSVKIYEYIYNTKVEDFGCIQHNTYKFLGASPDGINIDQKSTLYGRMLEIKNIVNREITGIPKKEYWIQTQLQMEVCDLDECDFLETKFTEYQNFKEFCDDGSEEKTEKGEFKGVIMYFSNKQSAFYVYKPLELINYHEIEKWEEEMIQKYESEEYNMLWIKNHYWKLEKLSCVLILRNKKWFQDNIRQLENVWNIILKERESGYEHRAPAKRIKKEQKNDNGFQGCLININKNNDNKLIVNKIENEILGPLDNFFVKIRTESLDETKNNNTIL